MMVADKMPYLPNRPIGPIGPNRLIGPIRLIGPNRLIGLIGPILSGIIFNTRAVGGCGVWAGIIFNTRAVGGVLWCGVLLRRGNKKNRSSRKGSF